jgi:hypothetical protein
MNQYKNKLPCNHGMESDFSGPLKNTTHFYCHFCKSHYYQSDNHPIGKFYTKEDWEKWLNETELKGENQHEKITRISQSNG